MSNFKNSIKSNYTQVPNEIINNKELSLKAKGLLCYLISKPDGWNFSSENIAKQNKEGLGAIKSALKELEFLGYLVRTKLKNDKGFWAGICYELINIHDKNNSVGYKSADGISDDGLSNNRLSVDGKRADISNTINSNKEESNNNNNSEIQNFGFEQELFENDFIELEAKKKPKEKSFAKKEKVTTIEDLAFPLVNEFWLKEFKQGYQYTAKDGLKAKSIIKKIKSSILSVNEFCDEITILNAFKAICSNLNKLGDFYATADLSIIDSKYNTIIEQIKTMKHGKQQTNNRQATAESAVEYARRKYGI